MTSSFYLPPEMIREGRFSLPEEEARHATKVLRMHPGDKIVLVDGEGGWYRAVIEGVDRHSVTGTVLDSRRDVGEPKWRLTIGMALVKNRARFETFLEKAVELGAYSIIPLTTDRTEKESVRGQRAENILISAMKQCGRSRLTRLETPRSLDDFLRRERFDLCLCCHEGAAPDRGVIDVLRSSPPAESVAILIGPEGGFTDSEIESAVRSGYEIVTLGARRLRAETAGIAAAAAVSLSLGG
ncbi:MAG: RsmE family RNA methyltransferase [Rhodothermales bacterium]